MDDSTAMVLITARSLASVINPALVAILLAAPFFKFRRQSRESPTVSRNDYLKWLFFCIAGIAIPVVLAETGKKREIWSGRPAFPSGHETFAAAAATCLVIQRPRLIVPALAIVAAMGWALVRAGYHEIADVLGASLLGPVCAIATSLAFRMRTERHTVDRA